MWMYMEVVVLLNVLVPTTTGVKECSPKLTNSTWRLKTQTVETISQKSSSGLSGVQFIGYDNPSNLGWDHRIDLSNWNWNWWEFRLFEHTNNLKYYLSGVLRRLRYFSRDSSRIFPFFKKKDSFLKFKYKKNDSQTSRIQLKDTGADKSACMI